MDSFSAKLAQSQNKLEHVVRVIVERMVAKLYSLYADRPGYVTCCGIIGSAMFWLGGYLLLYPPQNVLSAVDKEYQINTYYLASNILPFKTFIHIALLFLASITYWKIQNILSFCMTKCGCFYLFIHSLCSLVLNAKYLSLNYQSLPWDLILVPPTFISWFLLASFVGFITVNKEHDTNDELRYKWTQIKDKYHQLVTDNEEDEDIDDVLNDIDMDELNYNYNDTHHINNGQSSHRMHMLKDQLFIKRQHWVHHLYRFLCCNVVWYIVYCILQSVNNLNLIHTHNELQIGEWLSGYTMSFTMAFHRAFMLSCIYNIIFRPWCHNTVYIAMGSTLTSFLLNIGYLSLFFFTDLPILFTKFQQNIALFISFLLIFSKCIILCGLLFCEYKVYKLLAKTKEYNKHEIVRKRPTVFEILNYALDGKGDFSGKDKYALYLISYSSIVFMVSMQIEIVFMLFVCDIYLIADKEYEVNIWKTFNDLLLWSMHLSTIFVHSLVVSVQFTDSYVRASKLLAALNVALLIFAVWNVCMVSYSALTTSRNNSFVYLDDIVIVFCVIRALTAIAAWIGFSKLKSIHSFKSETLHYDELAVEEKQTTFSVNYVRIYVVLLSCYFVTCLYQYDWNGNVFILNGHNWSIVCVEPPEFGLLFHSGLLNVIFIFDAGISRRWAPTWDLSRTFLLGISGLGSLQIINYAFLYFHGVYVMTTSETVLLGVLLIWICVSFAMLLRLHNLRNLFLYKPKLFV